MDFNAISCGVAGQTGTLIADAKEKVRTGIGELIKAGTRRFLIALTGEASLLFAETVLSFREQYPDAGIDVLIPFDGWTDGQPDGARYKQITAQAESINYSCEEEYEDSRDICNHQLIGFGQGLVVVHDSTDKAMLELIADATDAEQEVWEIPVSTAVTRG